jgi:hypothetical protein
MRSMDACEAGGCVKNRKAVVVAGAAALTAFAATVGLGATFGLVDLAQRDARTGHVAEPTTTTTVRLDRSLADD